MEHVTGSLVGDATPEQNLLLPIRLVIVPKWAYSVHVTDYGTQFNGGVASELRAERARKGITLTQLVQRTGLSDSAVRRYLKGDRAIPMDSFIDLCKALEVKPDAIFSRVQDGLQ